MNYIKHLTGFFEKVAIDKTLNPTHVSLYIALFQFWNCNRFKNPISISRDEIMRISKISSKATYHKCLKNLHSLGYINYEPSYNPFKGSHVFLFNFSEDLKPIPKSDRKPKNEPLNESVSEQALNKSCTSSETGSEQAVVPSINNINNTNISNDKNVSNLEKLTKIFEEINNSFDKTVIPSCHSELVEEAVEGTQKEEKSSAKKEEKEMPENISSENIKSSSPAFADYNAEHTEISRQKKLREKKKSELNLPNCHPEPVEGPLEVAPLKKATPTIEEVKTYFQEQNFPEIEAQKFYNYFTSVGWLVGGKTPMVNWQAAAQNWIINAPKFISIEEQPNRANQLNTTTNKDYSEPL